MKRTIHTYVIVMIAAFLFLSTSTFGQSPAAYQIQRCEKSIAAMEKRLAKEDWNTVSNLSYSRDNLENLKTNMDQIRKKDPSYDLKPFQKKYDLYKKRIDSAGEGVANNYYYNLNKEKKAAAASGGSGSGSATATTTTTTTTTPTTQPTTTATTTQPATTTSSPTPAGPLPTYQIQQCEKKVASLEKALARENWNTETQQGYNKKNLEEFRKNLDIVKKKAPQYDVSEFERKYKLFAARINGAGDGVANNVYHKQDQATMNTEVDRTNTEKSAFALGLAKSSDPSKVKIVHTAVKDLSTLRASDESPAYWDVESANTQLKLVEKTLTGIRVHISDREATQANMELQKLAGYVKAAEAADPSWDSKPMRSEMARWQWILDREVAIVTDRSKYGSHDLNMIAKIFRDTLGQFPDKQTTEIGTGMHYSSLYQYPEGVFHNKNGSDYTRWPMFMKVTKADISGGVIEMTMSIADQFGGKIEKNVAAKYTRVSEESPNFYRIRTKDVEEKLKTNFRFMMYSDKGDMIFFDLDNYSDYNVTGFTLLSQNKDRIRDMYHMSVDKEGIFAQLKPLIEKMKKACAPRKQMFTFKTKIGPSMSFSDGDQVMIELKVPGSLSEQFPSGKPEIRTYINDDRYDTDKIAINGNTVTSNVLPGMEAFGSADEKSTLWGLHRSGRLKKGSNQLRVAVMDERGCPTATGWRYFEEVTISGNGPDNVGGFPKYGEMLRVAVEKYSTEEMPGAMKKDAAFTTKLVTLVNNYGSRKGWSTKYHKAVLISEDWHIQKNFLGEIIHRYRTATLAGTLPEGYCVLQNFRFVQEYAGDGKYSSNTLIDPDGTSGQTGIQCAKTQ